MMVNGGYIRCFFKGGGFKLTYPLTPFLRGKGHLSR